MNAAAAQIQVSMVANARSTETVTAAAEAVVNGIQALRWEGIVEPVRLLFNKTFEETGGDYKTAKKAVDEIKKNLPAVMWCGTFRVRKDDALTQYSGLVPADLDNLTGEQIEQVRDQARQDPHVWASFKSPTSGVKLIFRVAGDSTRHADNFRAVQQYVKSRYGLDVDTSGGNCGRICFVSADPAAFCNLDGVPLQPLPAPAKPAAPAFSSGPIDLAQRRRIFEEKLGPIAWESETKGFCYCPFQDGHSTANKPTDVEVHLDGAPNGFCVHGSCKSSSKWPALNREFQVLVRKAERSTATSFSVVAGRLSSGKPMIQLPGSNRLLSEFAAELGEILRKTHKIFNRGGTASTLNDRGDGLELISPGKLRTWIEQYTICFKEVKLTGSHETVEFRKTVSGDDAAAVLASPQFLEKLPQLDRLNPVPLPLMRPDGRIEVLCPGYDAQSRCLTLDGIEFPVDVPMTEAKQLIDELLSEFVFADGGRSRAVLVSGMLTIFGRGLLAKGSLRPVFVVVANASGAGKTLCVKLCVVPVMGSAPVGCAPKNEDEMGKILLTAILEAKPVIFFDNFKRHLNSESLEAFATAQFWQGRVLGLSKSFGGENDAVIFITGNAATVSPDLARRSLFVELFLEAERAEDRIFKHQLEVPELLERRAEILGALWAFVQSWDKAGRPKPSRRSSSFPEWSNVVGGIVEHAGFGCPLETPNIEAAGDTEAADMRSLVNAVAGTNQINAEVSFNQLVAFARSGGLFERVLPPSGELEPAMCSKLGKLFGRYHRRIVGNFRFVTEGKGPSRRFKVLRIEASADDAQRPEPEPDDARAEAPPVPVEDVL